jgi:PAS domain S-box-containing protein
MSIAKSKRSRLIISSLALLVVGVLAIGVVTYWARARQITLLQNQETLRQQVFATNVGAAIETEIGGILSSLKLAAQLSEVKNADPVLCKRKLDDLGATVLPRLVNMGRVNSKGLFTCSMNAAIVGRTAASFGSHIPEIFSDPQHKPVMSRAISAADSSSLFVAIHVPVTNSRGDFDGSLGGAISLTDLQARHFDDAKLSPNAYVVVVDDNYQILYHPQQSLIGKVVGDQDVRSYVGQDHDEVQASIKKALTEGPQTLHFSIGDQRRIAGLAATEVFAGRKWVVWIVAPASDIQTVTKDKDTVTIVISLIISLILLIGLFAAAIVTYVLRSVLNPVEKVANAAVDIGNGDFNRRVPYNGEDEIGQLSQAFNAMAKRLKESRESLEERVEQKTKELASTVGEMGSKNALLEQSKAAMLNVLDDLAQEKARVEKDHLRDEAIVNSIGEGLIITNEYGKIATINPTALETLGLGEDASKVVGQGFMSVVKAVDEKGEPLDPFERPITEALETGKVVTATSLYQRTDGVTIPVFVAVSPIVLQGRPLGAVEVFRDITKERELEKAKEEFVSLASHQLRTPATGVKAFTSMLLDGYAGKLTAKQREFLLKAVDSNERQLQIIDDMLNVARADSGRLVLVLEKLDLADMVAKVVDEQRSTIEGRHQTITVTGPKKGPELVADPSRLRMVIENFLSNASKYTPEKGKLAIDFSADDKLVTIKISDSGVGIAKKDIARLFKKFSRIDNPLSTAVGGTGLGLYLAGKIIELHKGKINVESKIGKGTTFAIQLPLKAKESKRAENPDS